ncbi:MAG TPA: hypothetical protein VKT73_13150 [Xanthobacteraceae bacterium]|nr:hypothetical protein [Xanthobacteraceae bacterium]
MQLVNDALIKIEAALPSGQNGFGKPIRNLILHAARCRLDSSERIRKLLNLIIRDCRLAGQIADATGAVDGLKDRRNRLRAATGGSLQERAALLARLRIGGGEDVQFVGRGLRRLSLLRQLRIDFAQKIEIRALRPAHLIQPNIELVDGARHRVAIDAKLGGLDVQLLNLIGGEAGGDRE